MNKEYIYLSDKEILVTDEKGHATKRDIEGDNMHEVLLLENDLEQINSGISNLEKIIDNEEKSKLSIKGKIVLATIPFIIPMTCYCIAGLFNPNLFSKIILTTNAMALFAIMMDGTFIFATRHHKEHINGIKSELTKAYQLKEELEQKLSNSKDKTNDSITTNIVKLQENNLKINDVIILEETTPFYEDAEKKLEEAYGAGYKSKGKRLILKK